jgi:hypothetical protein
MRVGEPPTTAASVPMVALTGVFWASVLAAGISPLAEVKVEGQKSWGTTIRHDAEQR